MDDCFVHASGQIVSRGHQAVILISEPGASEAVVWEVSSRRSGIAADVLGLW